MKKLLLCPPKFYDIRYEINPWMDKNNPINKQKSQQQYDKLKETYNTLGIKYFELPPEKDLPDQVFTTDIGHAEGKIFIRASFKYKERRKEADIAESFFKKKGYKIYALPQKVYFEGGDFIKSGDKYFFGWGKRSSHDAIFYLEKALDAEIIPIELPDDYFYHLDTCFAPISDSIAVANLGALTKEGISTLKKHFPKIIPTNDQDNQMMACNLIAVDKNAILTQGISKDLKKNLTPYLDLIGTVPMGEYLKGGGSIHCVSFEIFR